MWPEFCILAYDLRCDIIIENKISIKVINNEFK